MCPTAPPAVKLNGPQIGELVAILTAAFDVDEFVEAVLYDLNLDPYAEFATPGQPLKAVVLAVVSGLNRRDRVGELLTATARRRQGNVALAGFLGRVRSGPGQIDDQVGVVQSALATAKALARADDKVQTQLRQFKFPLELTRQELDRLARYKGLHDCLHTLQMWLDELVRAAEEFPGDGTAGARIGVYLVRLRGLLRAAADQTDGLPTMEDEKAWVADFEQTLSKAQAALDSAQVVALVGAVAALDGLMRETARIYVGLTTAARSLRLEWLSEALEGLLNNPNQAVALQLRTGYVALLELTPQLAGLVDVHDGWHRVDQFLLGLGELPPGTPPARVPRWVQIKSLLACLCPPGNETNPLDDPPVLADRWEKEPDLRKAETLYLSLRAAARQQFYQADTQLRTLTAKLTGILAPLEALLKVI